MACQRITFVQMVAVVLTFALHAPLAWCFANTLDWGITGLAIASNISSAFGLSIVVIYCNCSAKVTLQPLDWEAFQGWGEQLKVSLPIVIIVCATFWAAQGLYYLAGSLGVNDLAALTIVQTIAQLLLMLAVGIQETTVALIGNSIGSNNARLA